MRVRWPLYNIPFFKTDFLLSKDAVLLGPLQAQCGGYIGGLVHGYVDATGRIIIGGKAEIRGDITAKGVKVFGKVYGSIISNDIVIVYNTGYVKGDIKAKIILLKEGAHVEGIIIKTGEASLTQPMPGEQEETTESITSESAQVVIAEQVRSTDKDKDATTWF